MRGIDAAFHLAALIGIPDLGRCTRLLRSDEHRRHVERPPGCSGRAGRSSGARLDERGVRVGGLRADEKEHPLRGQSPYSATKIGADKLAEAFHLSFGLPVVTVRPFDTSGPRQSREQ